MDIKPGINPNKELQKNAEKFMRGYGNATAARDVLKFQAERRGFKSQGELVDYARKHGYLKTEEDVKVVKDVIYKTNLKEDADYDRKRRGEEEAKKNLVSQIMAANRQKKDFDIVLK